MKIGDCIRNYFIKTSSNNWDYESFKIFMHILGYKNKFQIIRNYNRELHKITKDINQNNNSRTIAQELIKEEVNIF